MSESGHQEVVMLFNTEGDICQEMSYTDFEQLLSGNSRLDACAASLTRAVYCVVGEGLNLRGAAFFQFKVDEEGVIDPSFNLPLRYLVQHAGKAEDLGQGVIRKASRAQCPVPWHAVNLWEPGADNGLELVQSRIYRNKLKLKSSTGCRDEEFFPSQEDSIELFANESGADADYPASDYGINSESGNGGAKSNGSLPGSTPALLNTRDIGGEIEKNQQFASRLNDVFGESGKLSMQDLIRLHTEQLNQAQARYRQDVESQQSTYLDQLRTCREEIHELKVALRHEQGRNRRLQEMLRGDL